MNIYFERVDGYEVDLPVYSTGGSAGMDFYFPKILNGALPVEEDGSFVIKSGEIVKIPLGLRCAFDNGFALMGKNRSSMGLKGLDKLAQVIDSDYRGELFFVAVNHGDDIIIRPHDRILQCVLVPVVQADIREGIPAEYLNINRGGGFGSTGR